MTNALRWAGIAVDIGGFKADIAAVTRDGAELRWGRAGTLTPQALGWDGCAAAVVGCIDQLVDATDTKLEAIYLAASGVDFPDEEAQLCAAIEATGRFNRVVVRNDTYALLASGGGLVRGVCVVAGSGMNCIGVLGDQEVRFAALGGISGDWGGGGSLSLAALAAACRAQDGRGPETTLRDLVSAQFGVDQPLEVTMLLHRGSLQPRDLLPLAEVVFAAALAGDAVAVGIIHRQAFEVAAYISAAHNRLGSSLGELPIILGGSVLRLGGPLLHEAIREQLDAPDLPFAIPDYPPILGALAGVLELLGNPADLDDLAARLDPSQVRPLATKGHQPLHHRPAAQASNTPLP